MTREELRAWLDRKPPRRLAFMEIVPVGHWRDFEPERCEVVEAGNGFRAVRVETGEMDLSFKLALVLA